MLLPCFTIFTTAKNNELSLLTSHRPKVRDFHYDRAGKKATLFWYQRKCVYSFILLKCFTDSIHLKIRGATKVGNDFKAAESFAN